MKAYVSYKTIYISQIDRTQFRVINADFHRKRVIAADPQPYNVYRYFDMFYETVYRVIHISVSAVI